MGHQVWCTYMGKTPQGFIPDVIFGMGVGAMEETFATVEMFPDVPLYCYNWDTYEWVWTNPRPGEYDYDRYGKLLSLAEEIWTPSECTSRRTTQWWGLEDTHVILSSCPRWDWGDTLNRGYILCSLREIPDPHWNWFERACKELGLPYRMTQHECSYPQYKEAVANCRFLVSHLYEASTGGLTLLEGYYHGKPCLISDSPWHGGRDYFGDRATYFDHTSYKNFKIKLQNMYIDPPLPHPDQAKTYVVDNFSDKRMINEMLGRLK